MYRLFCITTITLSLCSANLISELTRPKQIEVERIDTTYIHPYHVKNLTLQVKERAGTSNSYATHWEVIKDIPHDLSLRGRIYITDANYENEFLLLDTEIYLCQPDINRSFLPETLKYSIVEPGEHCVKKGAYDYETSEQIKFDLIVPTLGNFGKYYKGYYSMQVGGKMITAATVYFKLV